MTNEINMWIQLILLGGLAGMMGQGIRVFIGLKKLNDTTSKEGRSIKDEFSASSLIVSLFIGFVAGALAMISIGQKTSIDQQLIMTLIGAGYAGTDFIEGFMNKHLSTLTGPTGVKNEISETSPAVG